MTLDHKRIGILYLVSVLASFLLGGVYAELIRTKLITPGPSMVSANAYNQLFTIHGAVMIFMFVIPGIPAALGNFVLPLMLGAKDVAFPRLNLAELLSAGSAGPCSSSPRCCPAAWTPAGPSTRPTARSPAPASPWPWSGP